MFIRPVNPKEAKSYLVLRTALWPEADDLEEILQLLQDPEAQIFVAEHQGRLVGFAEAALRKYADGCETSPVGYLEGWYVLPEYRQQGIGRRLVAMVEAWARARGCTELASDAELSNLLSHQAHTHLGFEEVGRAVQFRKLL